VQEFEQKNREELLPEVQLFAEELLMAGASTFCPCGGIAHLGYCSSPVASSDRQRDIVLSGQNEILFALQRREPRDFRFCGLADRSRSEDFQERGRHCLVNSASKTLSLKSRRRVLSAVADMQEVMIKEDPSEGELSASNCIWF
jgi:hypothetical protein